MILCSLLIKSIFSVFRSPQLPFDTQFWTRGLPFANWSEAGALQSEVHIEIYDSKYMNRTKIVSKSKKISKSKIFLDFFWKLLFSTFYDTLFIINRKYFFGFSKSAATPRYTILDSRLTLCKLVEKLRCKIIVGKNLSSLKLRLKICQKYFFSKF